MPLIPCYLEHWWKSLAWNITLPLADLSTLFADVGVYRDTGRGQSYGMLAQTEYANVIIFDGTILMGVPEALVLREYVRMKAHHLFEGADKGSHKSGCKNLDREL